MKIALLVEDRLRPIPMEIQVVENWGETLVISEGRNVLGAHMLLSGDESALKNWLRPFDGVWVTVGNNPALEKFQVMHVREDEDS